MRSRLIPRAARAVVGQPYQPYQPYQPALTLVLMLALAPTAAAAPIPTVTGADPGNQFINESFGATACFDNTGDATGYQPIYELILPEGVTFTSGTFLGAAIDFTNVGTCNDPSDCTTGGGNALVNPDTGLDVDLLDGETLVVLRYPLGSNTPMQPPGCMDLTLMLGMPPDVQLGVPLDLEFTPVFTLGATADDDPATDPPIFGTSLDLEVTPAVLIETKDILAPEDETATGPNFTRTVRLEVDIATGETVNATMVTDTLPDEMQFVALTNNGGCTPTATPSTVTPGGTLTLDCGSVTGAGGVDVTIEYTFYVPELDGGGTPILDPSAPGHNGITNDSSATGTYDDDANGGTPEIVVSDDGPNTDDTITAKAIAIQKAAAIETDVAPTGTSPGDTIRYTLSIQISDYFDIQNIVVTDTLGDGQTFDGSFTPTFDVVENGPQPQGTFLVGTNFLVPAKNAAGETILTIDLSAAMVANGLDASLTGDEAADGSIGQGATTAVITFHSTIDAAYTGPVAGTQPLTVGDAVSNAASVASSVVGGGAAANDGSSDSVTIATPGITKAIHAFNGSTSLPVPLLIGAGDTLTYSIRIPIALGSFEELKLLDYLPIPLFDAAEVTSFSAAAVPPAGTWGVGTDDTLTVGIGPTLTTSPISAENTIEWDFGTDEGQGADEVIHILFTVTALDNPMADHLNLSNLILLSLNDSQLEAVGDAQLVQVTVKTPALAIVKDIVSSTNSNASASGSVPSGFDDAWEGADASDVMTFRFTVTNEGSDDAFDVQLTDRFSQGGMAGQGFTSCGSLTVEDGAGNPLATTGDLFAGTLSLTNPLPADDDGVVETNETAVFEYSCTVDPSFSPGSPIDNTATITNYASAPAGPNFATNPMVNEGKTRTQLRGIIDVDKSITASSLPETPGTNINQGEELTYTIVVTLAEGIYPSFSLTDDQTTVPAVDCSSPPAGMSCSANVSTAGSTVTVAGTTDSTSGTITYVYTLQQTAGGTNTATAQSSNSGPVNDSSSWTRDHPNPDIQKTITPDTADAGDTVTIQFVWQNNDTNNPIFGCTITDVLDGSVYDLSTVTEGVTPAGYAYGYVPGTGTLTYTDTSGIVDCPGGTATFTAQIRNDVVTSTTYTNTATISGTTLPAGHPNEGAEATRTDNGSDDLMVPPPSQPGKLLVSTSEDATDPSDTNIDSNPPVAIGEVLDVQITFAFPEGVTNTVTLSDIVDDGLTFIAGSALLDRNTTALTSATNPGSINANTPGTPVAVTPTLNGNDIELALGNVTNTNSDSGSTETMTLFASFVIANVTGNTAGTDLDDTGRITFEDSGGTSMNVNSETKTVHVALPVVAVDKQATPTSVTGGTLVTYTLDVSNTATGANASAAYELTFGDTLPADLTSPMVTNLDAGSTGATVNGSFAGNVLSGTIDRLDPGETVTITYTATVDPGVPFDEMITNTANANGTSLVGTNGEAATAPGAPGSATGERTGAGGVNNLFHSDPATITVDSPTLSKTTLNPQTRYPIESLATFEIRVGVPIGSATTFVVTDQLDSGLSFSAGSLSATLPTGASSTTGASPLTEATGGFFSDNGSGLLTFDFGDITIPTAGDIVITYDVVVDNILANQNNTTLDNSATLTRDDPDMPGMTLTTGPVVTDMPVLVGEPNLEMTKTITAGAIGSEAGDTISWQATVTNNGTTTAYQVDWQDILPTGLEQIANPVLGLSGGNAFLSGTATLLTSTHLHVATTTVTGDTLDLASSADGDASDLVDIEPGATVTISFDAVLANTVTPGQALTNTVRAPYTSLPTGGRDNSTDPGNVDDDDDSDLNNYEESATAPTLTVAADIAINKTVSPSMYTIGQDVVYQIRIDVIEGTTPSVRVVDVLPAGLTYQSHAIAAGNLGMTFGNPSYDTRLGTGQSVEFDFGDVSNPANAPMTDDFFTIDITARVDNILANQNAVVLRNGEAAEGSNVYVEYGSGPTRVDFDADGGTPGLQGLPITIVEPDLQLTKTVLPTTQTLGDLVTFTVTVQHLGGSTSDAFGIVLDDTLPVGLTYEAGSVSLPPGDVTVNGQNLQFRIASLTQATMLTSFTYQARVDANAIAGSPLTNDLRMTYEGLPGATGAVDGGRNGSDGSGGLNDYVGSAMASVTPDATAFIDAQKTVVDLNGPNLFPGESIEYTVVLTNQNSAVTGVVFTDTVPSEVTFEPGTLTTTKGTTDESAAPDLSVDVGGLAMGETVTITYRATVNNVPDGTLILNQGSVDSDQTVPEPTDKDGVDNNGDQPTDIVTDLGGGGGSSNPEIRAEKFVAWKTDVDTSGDVTALDIMTYTFVVTNTGTSTVDNVVLTDTIPTGLTFVTSSESTTGGATLIVTAPNLTLSVPTLAPGATISGSFDVEIDSPLRNDDGDPTREVFVNQGSVTSDQTSPVPTDGNTDPTDGEQPTMFPAVATPGTGTPALDAEKRVTHSNDVHGDGLVNPGDGLTYVATIQNVGAAPALNVRFDDPRPNNVSITPGSVVTSQGVVLSEDPISINIGTLNPGQIVVVSFDVIIDPSTPHLTNIVNQGTATATGVPPEPTDNNGMDPDGKNPNVTPVIASPDVAITKAATPTQRMKPWHFNFTVVVVNNGPSVASNVTVTDPMPAGLSLRPPVVPDPGVNCTVAPNDDLTCNLGTLLVGESRGFDYAVEAHGAGSYTNTATVTIDQVDTELGNNTDSATIEAIGGGTPGTPVPGLTPWGLLAAALGLGALGVRRHRLRVRSER